MGTQLAARGAYIRGRFVRARKQTRTLCSVNPAQVKDQIGRMRFSTRAADQAVEAARQAAPAWASTTLRERERYVSAFQRAVQSVKSDLARLISRETGRAGWEVAQEVGRLPDKIDLTRQQGMQLVESQRVSMGGGQRGLLGYRPQGVVVVLGPFNFPAHIPNGHIVPALLCGNTVVFKPSELTPFVGQLLMECWDQAGLPPGVLNMVQGDDRVGQRLVKHADVNLICFTGSSATGRAIQEMILNQPGKRFALEMGGKNGAVILRDAELDVAVEECILGACLTTGQRCTSTSRVFVQRQVLKRFLASLLKRVARVTIGPPDTDPLMGPLVTNAAMTRYLAARRNATRAGFTRLVDGGRHEQLREGYYVRPSIHLWEGGAPPSHGKSYWQQELFAPDLAVYPVRNLDEAIALNENTPYGLCTAIFTRRRDRYEAFYQQTRHGVVNWNVGTTRTSSQLPFGGQGCSGNGQPAGMFSPYYCTYPVASIEVVPGADRAALPSSVWGPPPT